MAFVPKPQFPNVPQLPGVPQLLRSPLFPPTVPAVRVGFGNGTTWHPPEATPQWGVFDATNTRKVVDADSILDFNYRKESRVSTYPVEEGAFASYNKVQDPFETVVRLSKGGSRADRSIFLGQIKAIQASLDLFTFLTPEESYFNCNVLRYEVTRRGSKGAYFLTEVDVFFVEIRQTQAQYSTTEVATANAKQPSSLPPVNQGLVQPQTTSSSVETRTRVQHGATGGW